ncbi:MAG: hypothetical protein ACLQMS_06495, partial [Desulfomonilaceae bacterium]
LKDPFGQDAQGPGTIVSRNHNRYPPHSELPYFSEFGRNKIVIVKCQCFQNMARYKVPQSIY